KRTELIYRWDLLDGKKAVYDVELTSVGSVVCSSTATTAPEGEAVLPRPENIEIASTTKQRLVMTFARGERDRGRVTIVTERLAQTLTETTREGTRKFDYDSEHPPTS